MDSTDLGEVTRDVSFSDVSGEECGAISSSLRSPSTVLTLASAVCFICLYTNVSTCARMSHACFMPKKANRSEKNKARKLIQCTR